MGKRIFLLIVVLMSIALIGIISVQVFWIKNTIQITEEQFTSNVRFALAKVSEDIKEREFYDFYVKYLKIIEKVKLLRALMFVNLFMKKLTLRIMNDLHTLEA